MLFHSNKKRSSIESRRLVGLRLTVLGLALLALQGCSFLSFSPQVQVEIEKNTFKFF